MESEMAYVVCLNCNSSFAIKEKYLPYGIFTCAACETGQYVRLTAS